MGSHFDQLKYIKIKNICGRFEICWDYQSAPEGMARLTQCERLDGYVDGFIDGLLAVLEVPAKNIHRSSSSKCIISDLEGHTALKLEKLLNGLFQPFVTFDNKIQNTLSKKTTIKN